MHRFVVFGSTVDTNNMQFIYSGGTATPTPSPRLPRKNFGYGQPFMPGYMSGQGSPHGAMVVHHHPHHHHHHHNQRRNKGDASLKDSIPAMSKPLAITCLICNIFLPGLGTFVAGLTVLCCSEVRQKGATKFSVVRVNTWVALLQFLTAFLFLLGWIWSVMWGAAFLSISDEFYKKSSNSHKDRSIPLSETSRDGQETESRPSSSRNLPKTQSKSESPTFPSSGQPMIVLQEPPVVLKSASVVDRTKPVLGHINPRQQRIMRRQMSDSEFSPFQLTNQTLENIIIHDGVHVANGNSPSDQSCSAGAIQSSGTHRP